MNLNKMAVGDYNITGISFHCMKCDLNNETTFDTALPWGEVDQMKIDKKFACKQCKVIPPTVAIISHFLNPYNTVDKELIKKANSPPSMEEWQAEIKSKYDDLKQVINDNLPQIWLAIEFALSVKTVMNIAGITLPWFGIILGRASSLKTAAIELFRHTLNTFYTDIFTAKAFVSNSTAVSKEKLKDIDMLPKVNNKLFLISELSSQLTKKYEEVQETIGILTRLADGHGLWVNTGAHGERGYSNIYFNILAAAVDIPYNVYRLLGYLGPKLYFLRLPNVNKNEDQLLNEMFQDEYPIKFARVREALNEYLNFFVTCPEMQIDEKSQLPRIEWSNDDDREASRLIVRLAVLLSHLRASVTTFGDTSGHGGSDYAYATAQIEEPSRAITQLRNLTRASALLKGQTHITKEDVSLALKVALSTAPIDRANIFDLLIAHKGKLTTSIIEESLNISDQTARKTITELKAIQLVTKGIKEGGKSHEIEITLKEKFNWFLTEEFAKLRDGFIPSDNRDELGKSSKSSLKENEPPSPKAKMYDCPRGCGFQHLNPSKIYEHRIAEHWQDKDLKPDTDTDTDTDTGG